MEIKQYWSDFLKETNRDSHTKYFEAFYFGSSEQAATNLLKLVLDGKKTATASGLKQSLLSNAELPKVGDLSIVTDWEGNPACIIETTNVIQMKFQEMTYDICKREGEDETLESWQQNHIDFFTVVGKEMGFEFSWDMDIIFEDFEVIYR